VGKPYTVRNIRPRRTVRLFGRTLASAVSAGGSDLDLSEEEVLRGTCLRLLAIGRLALVRHPNNLPQPLQDVLHPADEEPAAEPAVEPAPVPEPVSAPEPPPPEPEPELEFEEATDLSNGQVEDIADLVEPWTREELMALDYGELRSLAKDEGYSAAGGRVAIVNRILGEEVD